MAQMQLEAATEQQVLLVVDDREENLVAMEALLGDGQWNVRTVDSGEAALRCLMEEDVGLVLLDVQMPKMDGFEVARLMRGSPHTRHTPIIFLSAIAHTEDSVLQGYAIGAVDFTGDMPVILGPDGPSLGGFVCPVTVIEADLHQLGMAGQTLDAQGIGGRDLDHRQHVGHRIHARAAVFGRHLDAHQAVLAQGADVVQRKLAAAIELLRGWCDHLLGDATGHVLDHQLFVGEAEIHGHLLQAAAHCTGRPASAQPDVDRAAIQRDNYL